MTHVILMCVAVCWTTIVLALIFAGWWVRWAWCKAGRDLERERAAERESADVPRNAPAHDARA